ncbi:MAG: DUF5687 family protein [Bacteroidota bacterium]
MIYKWFVAHQLKESMRSSIWQKQIAINIIIGFFLLLMLMYLVVLGIFIDKILLDVYPDESPIDIFNGILLYYFGVELLFRFMMQTLPTLNITPYLQLPVKKSSIIHYLNLRSLTGIGNYLPLLVFIPFATKAVSLEYGSLIAFIWVLCLFLISISNNFLIIYLKRHLVSKPIITLIAALIITALILLDIFHIVSFSIVSKTLFSALLHYPLGILIIVGMVMVFYLMNFSLLKSKLYPEEIKIKVNENSDSAKAFQYLKQYGFIGQLALKDIKLIWRHKRTRSIVYMLPLFLGYGFFFYPQEIYLDQNGFLIFVGIFMTGGMMLNYLNYAFSYESGHFDFILSNYKSYDKYLREKFLFAIVISTVSFIITIPYLFFGMKILFINTMTWLYNIGFLSYLLFYTATLSKKRMDLSKGAAFNYQGMGIAHWLSMLPFFLLPLLIYWPFSLAGYPDVGLFLIGVLGFTGLLMNKWMMQWVMKQFLKRRYEMAEGFRQSE